MTSRPRALLLPAHCSSQYTSPPGTLLLLSHNCNCRTRITVQREFSVVSLSHHSVYGTAPKAFENNNYPIYRIMTVYNVVYMSRLLLINIDVSTPTNA